MVNLASSLATYGRMQTGFSTFMTVLCALCMVSVGVIMIKSSKSQRKMVATLATLQQVQCQPMGKGSVSCTAVATYSVDNVVRTGVISFNKRYVDGASITIYYDPDNPSTIQASAPLPKWTGFAVIACAAALVTGSVLWARAVQKSNSLATYAGASSAVGGLTSIF
jgi:hypothetical protein